MKNKIVKIITVVAFALSFVAIVAFGAARFVFLAPSCYSDNDNLTDRENYFIKKIVLEAVEDRLSVFGSHSEEIYDATVSDNEVIQLDESQSVRKHLFVVINSDFMQSVVKEENQYIVRVKTYHMESSSEDCEYEIHISQDYVITFFGLDA